MQEKQVLKSAQNSGASSRPTRLRHVLDFQVLYLLHANPSSLYELRKRMLDVFKVSSSYGTLHPHLAQFEKKKLVKSSWVHSNQMKSRNSNKRVYEITREGFRALKTSLSDLTNLSQWVERSKKKY